MMRLPHLLAILPSGSLTQWVKLPRQTRVTPEEYREFISLGHGEIFNVDLDRYREGGAGQHQAWGAILAHRVLLYTRLTRLVPGSWVCASIWVEAD
jgi:hypothetical protein